MQFQRNRLYRAAILALVAVFTAGPVLAAKKNNTSKEVAVVNGTAITRKDFNRQVQAITNRFASMGRVPNKEQKARLEKAILERMIEGTLLFQKAQQAGMSVNDKAVGAELAQIKARFPNEKAFKKSMATMDLSEPELKTQIKQGLTIKKFVDQKFIKKIKISDAEAKKFYEKNPQDFKQPEMVRASHILIKVPANADEKTREAARKKIEGIKKQLDKGADFATLAKKYSQGPSSVKGGDLGFFTRGQMVPSFEKAAFALKPGQVSGVVKTRFGYHLIKVQARKPARTMPFKEAKARIKMYLKKQKVKGEIASYLAEVKKKAKIQTFLPAKAS